MGSMEVDLVSFFETQEKLQNEESEDEIICAHKVMNDRNSPFGDAVREEDPESYKALRAELEAEYSELYAKAGDEREVPRRLRESSKMVEPIVGGLKPDTAIVVDDADSPGSKRKYASGGKSGSGKRARLGLISTLEPRRSPRLAKNNAAVVVQDASGGDRQERVQTPPSRRPVVQEKSWSQATTASHISVENDDRAKAATRSGTRSRTIEERQSVVSRRRLQSASPSADRLARRRGKTPTREVCPKSIADVGQQGKAQKCDKERRVSSAVDDHNQAIDQRRRTNGKPRKSARKDLDDEAKDVAEVIVDEAKITAKENLASSSVPVVEGPESLTDSVKLNDDKNKQWKHASADPQVVVVKTRAKKKKGKEYPQILKNVVILFVPIPILLTPREKSSSAMCKRMWKAEAHGATLVKKYDRTVTHIVVATDEKTSNGDVVMYDYSTVKKRIALAESEDVPMSVAIVDEWFLVDSCRLGRLLPPGDGSRSQVSGKFLWGDNKSGYRIAGHMERVKQVAAQKERALKTSLAESKISEADVASIEEPSDPETPPGEVPDSQPLPLGEPSPTKTAKPFVQNPKSPTPKRDPVTKPITLKRGTSQRTTLETVKKHTKYDSRKRYQIRLEPWKKQTNPRRIDLQEDPHQTSSSEAESHETERAEERKTSDHKKTVDPAAAHDGVQDSSQKSNPTSPSRRPDALDEAIEEASKCAPEHDEEADAGDSKEIESHRNARRNFVRSGSRAWKDTFACMHGSTVQASDDGPNAVIIEHLKEMSEYYERIKEPWKGPAYRKAINAIRAEKSAITTKEQALGIRGVGDRLADKIVEIATTKKLRRLEHAKSDSSQLVLQGFLQVYGAGLQVAQGWIAKGYKTLEDLRTKADLTRNQRIGVDHYDDFLTRIPRGEVSQHEEHVRLVIREVSDQLEITVGGSYRRGAMTCGDVDFLITSKSDSMSDAALRMLVFDQVIPRLEADGYIKASLATSSSGHGSKLHGAAALPNTKVWRRVDFLMVPWREWGAALLYFTGNDLFNRSIRLLASKKKMRLNQHGLYNNVLRGLDRQKLNEGTLVESRDEKKIFEILGVPYRPSEERAIG